MSRWSPIYALYIAIIIAATVQFLLLQMANKYHGNNLMPHSDAINAPSTSTANSECVSKIGPHLTTQELEDSVDTLLCINANNNPLLVDLVIKDRIQLHKLQRREYLRDLRSYRLSGLICNDHQDKSLPHVSSEPAFKCLPSEYKRRACMDGRASIPNVCNDYERFDKGLEAGVPKSYIPEPERDLSSEVKEKDDNGDYPQECKASSTKGIAECGEVAMAINSHISPRQLALTVPEAKVLTMTKTGRPIWRKEALDFHLNLIQKGNDVGPIDYPGSHVALQKAIDVVNVKGKSVAIFGSISPWVESIVHYNKAKRPTMTVDYNQPISYDERMKTELMSTMLEEDTQFHIIVSYSSIEHDGQGRYNDPLDPDGDLAAMKECWLKVVPGGYFLLHVPFNGAGKDEFWWFSQRIYGASRIPLLIRGWDYLGLATSKHVFGPDDEFVIPQVSASSPVMILRKPESVDARDVLDTNKFGGLECDFKSNACRLGKKIRPNQDPGDKPERRQRQRKK